MTIDREIAVKQIATTIAAHTELTVDETTGLLENIRRRECNWIKTALFIFQAKLMPLLREQRREFFELLMSATGYKRSHLYNFERAGTLLYRLGITFYNYTDLAAAELPRTMNAFLNANKQTDDAKTIDCIAVLGNYKYNGLTVYLYSGTLCKPSGDRAKVFFKSAEVLPPNADITLHKQKNNRNKAVLNRDGKNVEVELCDFEPRLLNSPIVPNAARV